MPNSPKPKAYNGNGKYIFISYSHDDEERVFPFIQALQKKYNVWFDEGIYYGEDYRAEIMDRIKNCSGFLFMVSDKSLASKYCRRETHQADELDIKYVNVLLDEDAVFPDWFSFDFSVFQMFKYYSYPSAESATDDLERKCPWLVSVRSDADEDVGESTAVTRQYADRRESGAASSAPAADKSIGNDLAKFLGSFDNFKTQGAVLDNYRPRFMNEEMRRFVADNDNVIKDIKKSDLSADADTIVLIKVYELFMTYKIVASNENNAKKMANILGVIDEDNIPERWHVLVNDKNLIVGYWVFAPVRDEVYDAILNGSMEETELNTDSTPDVLEPNHDYSGYLMLFGTYDDFELRLDEVYDSWIDYLARKSSESIFFRRIAVMLSTTSGKKFVRGKGMSESKDYDDCPGGKIFTYDLTDIGSIDFFRSNDKYAELVKNYTEYYKKGDS